MYLFQVMLRRSVSPEEGQKMLEQMTQQIDKQGAHIAGANVLKIPGVTRHEDPFPREIALILEGPSGLTFDPINFCYVKQFNTEREAVQAMEWFERDCRVYLHRVYPALKSFIDRIEVRVMDTHADLQGLENY